MLFHWLHASFVTFYQVFASCVYRGTVTGNSGAGVVVRGAQFTMNGGTISDNDSSGVIVTAWGNYTPSFTMNGGVIEYNRGLNHAGHTQGHAGGGIHAQGADVRIINGLIRNNSVYNRCCNQPAYGGGIYLFQSSLYIRDSIIENNHVLGSWPSHIGIGNHGGVDVWAPFTFAGGGVFIGHNSKLEMINSTIANNSANIGGGVFIYEGAEFIMQSGSISGNMASYHGNGGGIWLPHNSLANLYIGAGAMFSGNRAIRSFDRLPDDDAIYYANIHATEWTSPFTQGFNNVDIGFGTPTPYGGIGRLTIGSIEAIINQSNNPRDRTITLNVPSNQIVDNVFTGVITDMAPYSYDVYFGTSSNRWSAERFWVIGDEVNLRTGYNVFLSHYSGMMYSLIINPIPDGQITRLSIGNFSGEIDQEAQTITFNIPTHLIDGFNQFRGNVTKLEASSDTIIFFAGGQEWPMVLGDEAGITTGNLVYVEDGVIYTIIIDHQDPTKTITGLSIGDIAGVVNQETRTITFNVPAHMIDGFNQLRGNITLLEAASSTIIFFAGGQEWPMSLGQEAGTSHGDLVYVDGGII